MNRTRKFCAFVMALLVVTSCEKIDEVKHTSLLCNTRGYVEGATATQAAWEEDEQICLYRSEDWSAAMMSLTSGAGSDAATFAGNTAGTKSGYYAVRPASAVNSILPNGTVALTVEPNNIFLEGENSSVAVPQVGVGNKEGLLFSSIFGAVKFTLSGSGTTSVVTLALPNREMGLSGTFGYNLRNESILEESVNYEVTRKLSPLSLSSSPTIYVALAAGNYADVELLVRDDNSGNYILYTIANLQIERNRVTEASLSTPVVISCVVGSWHLVEFCGGAAEVDLYMEFTRDGKFTIYQRSGSLDYTTFAGRYTVDSATSTISGVYDDGEAWATDYRFALDEDLNLVFTSVANSSEVSVYEPSEMPSRNKQSVSRATATDVKPL